MDNIKKEISYFADNPSAFNTYLDKLVKKHIGEVADMNYETGAMPMTNQKIMGYDPEAGQQLKRMFDNALTPFKYEKNPSDEVAEKFIGKIEEAVARQRQQSQSRRF